MTNKQKQHLLAFLGYYTGIVDGIWGKQSEDATRRFQQDFGLTADGTFGDATDERIRMAIGNYDDLILEVPATKKEEAAADIPVGDKTESNEYFWEGIRYFKREEFKCTCGGRGCNGFPAEPVEQLVRNAESARVHFGAVADVSSGVRCQLRNSELPGSAANSLHMRGKAMDFRIRGVSSATLLAYVKTLPEVDEAYAIDEAFVHMGVLKY